MLTLTLFSLIFTVLPTSVLSQADSGQAPILYNEAHNATDLAGTWNTGSGVSTGPGFANPANYSFNYPKTTGRSFSFTNEGFFEQAEYRFSSNATDPHCITGVVTWQHGTYELLDNGSMILHPFAQDGRQQVQDPCAAVSNQLTQYNQTTLFQQWRIFALPDGGFHLNLYQFDGAPFAPMSLTARPPVMLPTTVLTGNTTTAAPTNAKRAAKVEARSDAPRTMSRLMAGGVASLMAVSAMLLLAL